MRRLENKIAIVTGGAGGLGSATVRRFVSEGAHVVVADMAMPRALALCEELGGQATPYEFDAENTDSVRGLIENTIKSQGRVDILYNNHAATHPSIHTADSTVVDVAIDIWRRTFEINLLSYFVACKTVIPHMISNGGGAIIQTASDAGLAGDVRNTAYGVSKAGVISLTQHVAAQYGRQGVRCNTIAPGMIMTDALRAANPDIIELVAEQASSPRRGEPEDIAALAAYLASDDSGYVNGQTISCDGGLLAHQPHHAALRAYEAKIKAGG